MGLASDNRYTGHL